jgi:hypothetical protein
MRRYAEGVGLLAVCVERERLLRRIGAALNEHVDVVSQMASSVGIRAKEFAAASAQANQTLADYNLAIEDYNHHLREHGCDGPQGGAYEGVNLQESDGWV